jgi:hypothetical protein
MALSQEQIGKLHNKVWTMFNENLNHAVAWEDSRKMVIEELTDNKAKFDDGFEVSDTDPLFSEKVWEVRMEQFDLLINIAKAIQE